MDKVNLKQVDYKGISVKVPEIWNVVTESYSEPDGRECAMMDISAVEGDPRSIVISYGPMPEGSDALFEAGGTYDELMEDLGADSLDTVELVMTFEEKFSVEVPDEDAEKLKSVADVVAYIKAHQA